MLQFQSLAPGTYRVYALPITYTQGTFLGNTCTALITFPVVDGKVRYSDCPISSSEFDDDLDRSSITTTAGYCEGEHDVSHHKVESFGIISDVEEGSGGYNREPFGSANAVRLSTKYKSITAYLSGSWQKKYYGTYTYTAESSPSYLKYEMVWLGSSHTQRTIIENHLAYNDDGVSINWTYKDWWDGRIRSNEAGNRFRPWSGFGSGYYLDFTVTGSSLDPSTYISRWQSMLDHCGRQLCQNPEPDIFGACLQAAQDFNAYDVNLIEALAGFSGLDDLMPVGVSKDMVSEIEEFCAAPSLITSLTKSAYLAATTYLYSKYVYANNIADFLQLTGLSKSSRFRAADEIARQLADTITDRQQAEWNFRMAKMAQKIVYGYDYLQDSYGAKTAHASNAFDSVTLTSRAHLQATPGPLRDMTAVGIICDDIGLSLRASRLAQAVKLEFIANWFLPIEDSLDRVEFNATHLNQLYRVKKLVMSNKIVHSVKFEELKWLYGLQDVKSGSVRISDYNRWSSKTFPPTTFQHSDGECLSVGRLLQGSALIITAFGRS